jgi:hypothetical protein
VLNGTYQEFDWSQGSNDYLVDTAFTSFAYPGFFPPNKAFGSEWFDGASVQTLDVLGAINKCKAKGVTDEKNIIIDIILNNRDVVEKINGNDLKAIGMLVRFIEIYWYYGTMNGLKRAQFSHPNVTYRNVISPSDALTWNYLPLSLNETQVQSIIDLGVKDGAAT